jgi:hypothetical protein
MASVLPNKFKRLLACFVAAAVLLPVVAFAQDKDGAGLLWQELRLMLTSTLTVFDKVKPHIDEAFLAEKAQVTRPEPSAIAIAIPQEPQPVRATANNLAKEQAQRQATQRLIDKDTRTETASEELSMTQKIVNYVTGKPKPDAQPALPRAQSNLPLLDGNRSRTMAQPQDELKLPSIPNARELFELVTSCWPEKSFFRGELSLEGRTTRSNNTVSSATTFDPVSGTYTNSNNNYVALVAKIPLYSGVELDRERERETQRRTIIANAIGVYISALAEHKLNERELQMLRALEVRAKLRVEANVTQTNEQVNAFEKVATLENKNIKTGAELIKSRIQLSAMCDDKRAWIIDGYLKKFTELN